MVMHLHECMHVIAEIKDSDLRNEPTFAAVVRKLNRWFKNQMSAQGCTAGVLVSHNAATDFQFLQCEYIRAGMRLPSAIKLGLDTYKTLTRFSSICYRKVSKEQWPLLTKTGKLSMGVKPCAIYALSKRTPPQKFEDECGEHHDAEADTRAIAVILFDVSLFGSKSLYHTVFKSNRRCFQPLSQVREAMEAKMKEPVLKFEELPQGWIPAPQETPNNDLSGSGEKLPECVPEVRTHPH